jgi:3-oxoacyl-(acyl-carrier-protein) synthase
MDNIVITAEHRATQADLQTTRLGPRFGRMDLSSQLALLAVEPLAAHFDKWERARIGICLVATAGSLSTDLEYWNGRSTPAGPSPTLFAYTLPSAALGEIAIRHRLTGPGVCLVGGSELALRTAADMLKHSECEACVCVACAVISEAAAALTGLTPAAGAHALLVTTGADAQPLPPEFDRDMKAHYA